MRQRFIAFLLLVSSSSLMASEQKDLQTLMTTCSCQNCNLTGAKLIKFWLGEYPAKHKLRDKLNNCNLAHADLSYANLNYAKLIGAGRSYPLNVSLTQAKLVGARLQHAEIYRINASEADFRQANFNRASIQYSNFNHANFTHAVLKRVTTLSQPTNIGTYFSQANFNYANLSYAQLDAKLDGASFQHANLAHAILDTGAIELQGGNTSGFVNIDFSHANLSQAQLYEISGAPVPFNKVNFTGADLKGAKFFSGFRLDKPQSVSIDAAIFCHTIMPDGRLNNRDCHAKTS